MAIHFSEKVILNDISNFPEVRHIVLKGSNFEIGNKLGELANNRHNIVKSTRKNLVVSHCQKVYMQSNYPIFYERMAGIAKAYGKNLDDDSFDFSLLGEPNMGIGCSAVYYPPDYTLPGHGIISRNLDFPLATAIGTNSTATNVPSLSKPYIMEMYPDRGYPTIILLSFELLGESLEGINSEGLTVIHLADNESQKKYQMEPTMSNSVGINEFKAIQLLLDTCSNVTEAKQALLTNKHFYMIQPIHLLVADRYGNSFVWEYSHAHNKEYIIDGDNTPQIVTNFLLHRYNSISEIPQADTNISCPYNRYMVLFKSISKNHEKITLDSIKEISALAFIQDNSFYNPPPIPVRTLWNSIYDTADRSLQISFYLRDCTDSNNPGKSKSTYSKYFKFTFDH